MFSNRSMGWVLGLSLALVIAGCGGGGGGGGDDDDGDSGSSGGGSNGGGGNNNSSCSIPSGFIDEAGPNQSVKTGSIVQLDGSDSRGEDGDDPDSYQWSFTSRPDGSSAELSSNSSAAPQFTPDVNGEYVVQLTIDGIDCEDATDSVEVTATQSGENGAPNAAAGTNQTVTVGDTVTLDGSDSSDPDGGSLDYSWEFASRPDNSDASLSNSNVVSPSFTADEAGTYVVRLQVGDRSSVSDSDEVTIVAQQDTRPTADAGPDQSVGIGSTVRLDGSDSSDPNEQLITYDWHFLSAPEGSNVQLAGEDTVRPVFQPDLAGTYVASLTVNNGDSSSEPDTVIVTASQGNSRPVANAGTDQNVSTGVVVNLDGGESFDANGDNLGYHWVLSSMPRGSQTSLTRGSSATPSFTPDVAGQYVAQLRVDDGTLMSAPDSVVVTAAAQNSAPVADAGNNQSVNVSQQVSLNGSDSSDANSDSLSYHWHMVSRPEESSASLNDADSIDPDFTADVAGFYVVSLTVDDGQTESAEDHMIVTATPALALYVSRGDSGYELLADSGGSDDITLAAGTSDALLNRFRLRALGSDYTIENIRTTADNTSDGTPVESYFDGLSEGQEIDAGDSQDFQTRLRSVPNEQGTYHIELRFTAQPSGRNYNFTYNVEVN
ncbi:PKD domain-containing protein [Salinisphaera sp. SPP-AMP-43]|uniref:PKD domain-containing protein n=1 Tax=Salinisphaera sp. SPP-AMP-43 TaxID=3121288 RepID=UPI003C6DF6BC